MTTRESSSRRELTINNVWVLVFDGKLHQPEVFELHMLIPRIIFLTTAYRLLDRVPASNFCLFWVPGLVLAALMGCQSQIEMPGSDPLIQHVQTIGGKDGEEILLVEAMTTDESGNLYVLDSQGYSVMKYDASGRLVARAGQRGEGPGYFKYQIKGLAVSEETVWVTENLGKHVHTFTPDLAYRSRMDLDSTLPAPFTIARGPSGSMYTGAITPDPTHKLMRFDTHFRLTSTLALEQITGNALWDVFKFCVDRKERLIVGYGFLNFVEICSTSDGTCTSFAIHQGFEEPALADTILLENDTEVVPPPNKFFMWDIAIDPQERIFILAGDYARHPQRDIYVYDYDGNWIKTLVLPEKSKRLHIDHNGDLYVSDPSLTLIKKYKVNDAALAVALE